MQEGPGSRWAIVPMYKVDSGDFFIYQYAQVRAVEPSASNVAAPACAGAGKVVGRRLGATVGSLRAQAGCGDTEWSFGRAQLPRPAYT